jgi:uncharacterized protein YidB (DUF937 family)
MNIEDILKNGAETFAKSNLSGEAGSNLNLESIQSAIANLLGDGSGKINIGSLLAGIQEGGVQSMVESWLGDGENAPISVEQVSSLIGSDKLREFASKLGLSQEEAAGGLSEALPQIVDNSSSSGSLLDAIGGVDGAMGFAKKLFG